MATHIVYIKRTTRSPIDSTDADIMNWLEATWQQVAGSAGAIQVYLTLDDSHYVAAAESEDDEAILEFLRTLRGTGEFDAKASKAYSTQAVAALGEIHYIGRK